LWYFSVFLFVYQSADNIVKQHYLLGLQVGPENPFKTNQQKAKKNTLTGFVEASHISEFQFETQRRTFDSYG